MFNHLPQKIKKLSDNTNTFKRELKKFLLLGSFYSLEEFYGWTSMRNLLLLLLFYVTFHRSKNNASLDIEHVTK
jgi:hypothetical protein